MEKWWKIGILHDFTRLYDPKMVETFVGFYHEFTYNDFMGYLGHHAFKYLDSKLMEVASDWNETDFTPNSGMT